MNRQEGYYWVKPSRTTTWEIAFWGVYDWSNTANECWQTTDGQRLFDIDMQEINEHRLLPPNYNKNESTLLLESVGMRYSPNLAERIYSQHSYPVGSSEWQDIEDRKIEIINAYFGK